MTCRLESGIIIFNYHRFLSLQIVSHFLLVYFRGYTYCRFVLNKKPIVFVYHLQRMLSKWCKNINSSCHFQNNFRLNMRRHFFQYTDEFHQFNFNWIVTQTKNPTESYWERNFVNLEQSTRKPILSYLKTPYKACIPVVVVPAWFSQQRCIS